MTWEEIMRRVLPPVGGLPPHITSEFGSTNRPVGSTNPHKGVDFNFPVGQTGINKSSPTLHSPVAGVVLNAGEGNVGRIAIRDANGFVHEILHTHTQNVRKGDLVGVATPIGTMGNRGVKHANVESGDYHVHYQLKDRSGNVVNPTEFWNSLGAEKNDPSQPAHLDQSRRATEIFSGLNEKSSQNGDDPFAPKGRFDIPFSEATGDPFGAAPPPPPTPTSPTPFIDRFIKFGSAPRPSAPAASGDATNFADRFGNWASAPAGAFGNINAPAQLSVLPSLGQRPDIPDDVTPSSPPTNDDAPADIPVRRLVNRSLPTSIVAQPLAPDVAASSSRPLGIASGQPMRDYPLPPPIWGFSDKSSSPEDDEISQRWRRWLDV